MPILGGGSVSSLSGFGSLVNKGGAMSSSDGSVTLMIGDLRKGDENAAQQIWDRYSPRLAALARLRLPARFRSVLDGEDIACQALETVVMGLNEGKFPDLRDRDDLWALLACVTVRKARNDVKHATRQKRAPIGAREPLDENLVAPTPAPDLSVMAAEQFEFLLERLARADESLRIIAYWRFEGYTREQIADRMGCSKQKVIRKLELVRKILAAE